MQTTFSSSVRGMVLATASMFALAAPASAGTLGINLDAGSWSTTTSSNWTLGFEFSLSDTQSVSGLGFWDIDGVYSVTTVGLWKVDGTLIDTVDSGTSAVRSVATSGGPGGWYMMDYNTTLVAGSYVIGSHGGSGMDYAFGGPATESILSFADAREQFGGIFQFPGDELFPGGYGFFGANIEFIGTPPVPIPVPAALPLLVAGLAALGLVSRRRSRKSA